MQERYLGDVHDYIKFALLRHLHEALKVRIGVNWYLTAPENNGDGGQRGYLEKSEWKSLDEELFLKLRPYLEQEYRTLENFEKDKILPENTLYFRTKVSAIDGRSMWHNHAIFALSQAQLIFLDQDNGFEVKPESMSGRTHKYALYKEAFDYYDSGKIVIGIQFAAKVKPLNRVMEVRKKLIQSEDCSINLPVLRGRVTPNILFFAVSPLCSVNAVGDALKSSVAKSPVFKKLEKRVELIP